MKVLDFGLAKAVDPTAGSSANAMNSPTLTAATVHGVILGTAAYMSPEQAAGKLVDKRSDLWAFGVVLMEMLSGRQVFTGETVPHVLAGGGIARADELAYDPLDHILLIANDRETTCVTGVCTGPAPFVTFINTETRTVLGAIDYPQVWRHPRQ